MGRFGRTVVRFVLGTVLVGVLVVVGVAVHTQIVAGQDERGRTDAILVLGAAQYNGDPSPVFQARLDHAKTLYDEGVAPAVVTVGGGQAGDATTEGAAGREYLADLGIDPAALVAVGTGGDTLLSLRAAAPVLAERGWDSVTLVTDPYHAARAERMAQDLGWDVSVSSVSQGPSVQDGVQVRYLVRETLGSLYYLLTGASSGAGTPVL
ncbi:YdcF family protein [Nakamurella leprariae]|uniref:YdcF family protein n=1 Tax=Nakamurella leprariae TaxID=2803911 RepID=A0A938YBK9_9ACTN|nr:YdcF family protein [Nakamurella leprariae]MBM9469516.1 YdcF family protein [Nakamurella leprariae]